MLSLFFVGVNIVLVFLGFIVGLLIGLTGMGGGALMTPALVLLGINPAVAVGSDLAYGSVTKIVGAVQHYRQETVNLKAVLYLASGSVPMSLLGAGMVSILVGSYGKMGETILRFILSATLILVGALLFYRTIKAKLPRQRGDTRVEQVTTVGAGALIGFLVGLTSVGSGSLITIFLLVFSSLPARKIVGTDVFHSSILVAAAALAHWSLGNVESGIVAQLLIGSIPGVLIGSRLNNVVPTFPLRILLSILILASGLALVLH